MRAIRIREVKDYKIRYSNFTYEDRFVPLRAIAQNSYIRSEFRVLARYLLYRDSHQCKFPNNFRNRCLMTGRVRAVLPYFKLSRIEFRQLAKQNYFMGVKKSSWLVVISNIVELWIMNIPVVLSSLRNAGLARKPFATVPLSKLNINLLDLLYAEGFISGYSIHKHRHQIRVRISYLGIELPLVSSLKLVSRPGLRTYVRYAELVKCYSGRFLILSTRLGLVTGTAAITNRCGGELYALRYYFLF